MAEAKLAPIEGPERPPVVLGDPSAAEVTETLENIVFKRQFGFLFFSGVLLSFTLLMILLLAISWLLTKGVGIWGINVPVSWGFAITNFVWWIGIGHAGTFISAILYLLHQEWRTSINRFAEAMTIFAVACAGLFPLLHLGRPWFFYWLVPYPDTMDLWPQWRSPLIWDIFAVGTYFTISLVFWYLGMVPDLASYRDHAPTLRMRRIYGVLSLGWRGDTRHWARYQTAYLLLAGLATPLVISVHSVVGMDFTAAIVPGWHSTIVPPYFVAGAIFSGFAMVLTLAIPIRHFYRLQHLMTERHLENCAKLLLATGLIVDYSYVMETFFGWYSGDKFERYLLVDRALGVYGLQYWTLIACNVLVTQSLWWRAVRRSPAALFVVAIAINFGMWIERYVIVINSLHRDFLPSSWGVFSGTIWDYLTLFGSMGLFFFLFLAFARWLPVVAISELRELVTKHAGEKRRKGEESHAA